MPVLPLKVFFFLVLLLKSYSSTGSTISLQTPNGGEAWEAKTYQDIIWQGQNIYGTVYLQYSINAGQTWNYLSWGWSADTGGVFTWQVPLLASTEVLVKITYWDNQSVYDISASTFEIFLPDFALIYPNGGNNLYPGEQKNIEWNAVNSNYLIIELSTNGGNSWQLIADSVDASTGSFNWTVPATPSTQCLVRITDMDTLSLFDVSDNTFTINEMPSIELVYPNGGEVFEGGDTVDIQWTGSDIHGNIQLQYSTNGGATWSFLGWGWGNASGGTFSWTVPSIVSSDVLVKAIYWDMPSVNAQSNAPFTIQMPSFVLNSPNGNESLYPATTFNITWNALNTDYVSLSFSADNGSTWQLIQDSVDAAPGTYPWFVPNMPSPNCLIQIRDMDDSTRVSQSQNTFTILTLPTIELISPAGGEVWEAGEEIDVVWTGTNLNGNLVIELTTNDWHTTTYLGAVWGWTTGGNFSINLPFIQTANAKIRVRLLEAPTVNDENDVPFSIIYPDFSLAKPNGGESLYPTNQTQIQWHAANSSHVSIDYSIDNGAQWTNIEAAVNATTGIYDWTIPNTPSNQCKVRITDIHDTLTYDISQNVFTIKTLPTIELLNPLGGDTLMAGSTYTITWTGTNLEQSVRVFYSLNSGVSWTYIGEVWDMYNGASLDWFVPFTPTSHALVRVQMFNAQGVYSQSLSTFTIANPAIAVVKPGGGESYYPFTTQQIEWVADSSSSLKLEYTVDNGVNWHTITDSVPASASPYNWLIPDMPSSLCRVRITDTDNPQLTAVSDTSFTIKELPQIFLHTPTAGEVLTSGSVYNVSWTGHNLTGNVGLKYSLDDWATHHVIDYKSGNPYGDSYNWTVPFTPSANARLRVFYNSAPTVMSETDSSFIIEQPPFSLIAPNGGEKFFPESHVFIQWTATNTSHINIDYTTDDGLTWQNIAMNVNAGWGAYNWVVPNTPSEMCKVRITDAYNTSTTAESIDNFTIHPRPEIQMVYPNGFEQFTAGNTYLIEWSGSHLYGMVRLEYSTDGGSTWHFIANINHLPNGGTYFWNVPYDTTQTAKVKATFLGVADIDAESDDFFSISYPELALLYPNTSGISFYPDEEALIQWIASTANYVTLKYTYDNGLSWHLIADSVTASLNEFLWTVPNTPSTTCKVRIYDTENSLSYSTSNKNFTIRHKPVIHLVKPIAGDDFMSGDAIKIKWTGAYITGGLIIDYTTDDGNTWHNIGSHWGSPNGGTYYWTAPHIIAEVMLRLTFIDMTDITAQNDTAFTICYQPELYVTSTPFVCQPHSVDISLYFTDSLNTAGTVSYFTDSLLMHTLAHPHNVDTTGTYYIYKQTLFGSCADTVPIEVKVGNTPQPPVVISPHIVCSGDHSNWITAVGTNVSWYADSSLQILTDTGDIIDATQFYSDTTLYVVQHEHPACPSQSATLNIIYSLTPQPPAVATQPAYCAGDTINDITASGNMIRWYADSSLTNLIAQDSVLSLATLYLDTVFYVTQTDNYCESHFTVVPITVNPVPPQPVITQIGTELVSSAPTGNEWYDILNTFYSNAQYFTPPQEGYYYVLVTINGCTSDTSEVVYYFTTEISADAHNDRSFFVYPNPFKEKVYIVFDNMTPGKYDLLIYNMSGQSVYKEELYVPEIMQYKHILETKNLKKGVYNILIFSYKEMFYEKLIKH